MREDEFQRLYYQPVRDSLKRGRLNHFTSNDLKEIDRLVVNRLRTGASDPGPHPFRHDQLLQVQFLNLQFHLRKHGSQLSKERPPVYYKALSILLEFRDYLGALSAKEKAELAEMAHELLKEIRRPRAPSDPVGRERLKEQIRLVCVHANQRYRDGEYDKVRDITDTLKQAIDGKLRPMNTCRTVLAGIYYLEGKVLRNSGNYPDCEKSLSESIEAYTAWTLDNSSPENITLASYKNAMSLGGIAWCKNMRGFNRVALTVINAARLLILPTEWELDKAHLDMTYADIRRTFAGENDPALADAIAIARNSYDVFDAHPHERLRSRAAFTLALLNFYAGEYGKAEESLKVVKDFSSQKKEARWLANAHILLARIRNKQGAYSNALEQLLPEAIKNAEESESDDRIVLAYIVKSESLLGLGQYGEAVEALRKAQKVNDKASGKNKEVGSERNKGWIFLNFAQAHLRRGELGTSKYYLDQWRELRGIKYRWLLDFADAIEQEHTASDFIVSRDISDLSWEKRKDELARWLIEVAKLRIKSDDKDAIANELKVTTKTLGQLQSPRKKQSRSPREKQTKKSNP